MTTAIARTRLGRFGSSASTLLPNRRGALSIAIAGLAATGLVLGAPAAGATTSAKATKLAYTAKGSTVLTSTGSTVTLGPSTLSISLKKDGTFSGKLPLPPASSSFKILGLVPVNATVSFIPDGPVTGKLVTNARKGTARVTSRVHEYVQLSDVTAGGIPAFVGNSCETVDPVTIPAATPKGKQFNPFKGGTLTGTYDLGKFANCGLTTGLINELVPGEGNSVTLKLSDARAGSH